ncbi:hypothetical protein [Actibacterium mucosum]|uniref:hypothetical protein n=1 Tax=Actibacterium mucosum TaxID=1087332 RepID=UPI0013775808|nr:hypothetical protein [Actibacterium mucosum]
MIGLAIFPLLAALTAGLSAVTLWHEGYSRDKPEMIGLAVLASATLLQCILQPPLI